MVLGPLRILCRLTSGNRQWQDARIRARVGPFCQDSEPPASSWDPTGHRQCARILYMTTVPVAEARQNFSALVDEAVATHQRVLVTRNGVPVVWMISDEDFESIMETLNVLADAAAMQDVEQSKADSAADRYVTAAEMEKIMAARAQGIDLGDDADVVADMHARGLPDPVCMATLEALISLHRQQAR